MKGQKTGGREKGVPNKVTKDLRETARLFVSNNIDKMQGWVDKVEKDNPERAFNMVRDMFDFVLPKLSAVNHDFNGSDVTINVSIKKNEPGT